MLQRDHIPLRNRTKLLLHEAWPNIFSSSRMTGRVLFCPLFMCEGRAKFCVQTIIGKIIPYSLEMKSIYSNSALETTVINRHQIIRLLIQLL